MLINAKLTLMMAKNPVFAILSPDDRRRLQVVAALAVERHPPDASEFVVLERRAGAVESSMNAASFFS